MNTLKIWILLILLGIVQCAAAQMTDSQVEDYVRNGLSKGKSQTQIGQELIVRGVTQSQAERLRAKYSDKEHLLEPGAAENLSASRSRTPKNVTGQVTPQTPGNSRVPDSLLQVRLQDTVGKRQIFGRNIFDNPALTFEPNENQATPENYRLGPGDEVIIDIWGANEANLREEISPEGNIMVAQLGPVYLNGLTIKEANEKIRNSFAQMYSGVSGDYPESHIRITLGLTRTILVNVMGEVAVPGTYRLSSFSTIFNALYRAGGVTDIGSLRNIRVMRAGKEVGTLDMYAYILRGDIGTDIRLQEGDVVIVPPYESLIDITGKVKRPMYYEMKPEESVALLLDYAGGFMGDAYSKEVRLVRKTGQERQLFNVKKNQYETFLLEDGDSLSVGAVLDRFSNRVEVRGAVYRPGMYELNGEMETLRQLIARAEGLRGEAFMARAQLYRECEDLTAEVVAVDLQGVMSGAVPDIELRKNDILVIPSIHDLTEEKTFLIDGQVANPGIYPYVENTTLEDLIMRAGGLLEGASMVKVDIARRLKDPKSQQPTSDLGKVFTFVLKDGFVVDGQPGFVLQPYDLVSIRKSPAYQVQRRVTVDGEVAFEGTYALIRKNERLSDLVKRTGGLTVDAYAKGGRLIRTMNDEEKAVRDATLRMVQMNQNAKQDSVSMAKLRTGDHYTVGIELEKALANPGSDYDMVLREGDRLVVPEYVSTVNISGEVMYPNTVLYLKKENLKYYIGQAGGFAANAKKGKAYIVYMNGTVSRVKSYRKARIEPGCEIIIPGKRDRRGISVSEILGLATSAASIGTMAASIGALTK